MFGALPDHIIEHPGLTHADIRVLLAMSLHANAKTGKAWPKANKLAERLGMSRSTVMSSLGKCVRMGLLSKRSRSANGLRIAMEYTFEFERFDSQRTSLSCESTSLSDERTSLPLSADIVVRAEVQQEQTSEQTKEHTEGFTLTGPAPKEDKVKPTNELKKRPQLSSKHRSIAIIDLYVKICVPAGMSAVRTQTDGSYSPTLIEVAAKAEAISGRDCDWQSYFTFAAESQFLCGKKQPSPGRKRFRGNLAWITSKIHKGAIEAGQYHEDDRPVARPVRAQDYSNTPAPTVPEGWTL